MEREYLDLFNKKGGKLFYSPEKIEDKMTSLDLFLAKNPHLKTKKFAKTVLFSHELQANNQIEGLGDDIELIKKVIEDKHITDEDKRKRIFNLYNGYNYILNNKDINKDTLKELYTLLSTDLLIVKEGFFKTDYNALMGEYYRTTNEYILKNGRLDFDGDLDPELYEKDLKASVYFGINPSDLETYMDYYFTFLNNNDFISSLTDKYLKSQILHYYFVYIHPYYDLNGRTSRTLSMWYLLNEKAYPYIIFNRGITFKKREYEKVIEDVRKFNDLTFFLNYMLSTVLVELNKESKMEEIVAKTTSKVNALDYQTLLYFLSLKNGYSICDFASLYNHLNDPKRVKEIYETMIIPLLDKGILDIERKTSKNMFNDSPNLILKLK